MWICYLFIYVSYIDIGKIQKQQLGSSKHVEDNHVENVMSCLHIHHTSKTDCFQMEGHTRTADFGLVNMVQPGSFTSHSSFSWLISPTDPCIVIVDCDSPLHAIQHYMQ